MRYKQNPVILLPGNIAALVLLNGDRALTFLDVLDVPLVIPWTWRENKDKKRSYAVTNPPGAGMVYMHRLLMGMPDCQVDHWNRNGLDNRRWNLRKATQAQNLHNYPGHPEKRASRYKGLKLDKESGKWHARISADYKVVSLGRFASEEDAARAYDAAALRLHGEFAFLNFPEALV